MHLVAAAFAGGQARRGGAAKWGMVDLATATEIQREILQTGRSLHEGMAGTAVFDYAGLKRLSPAAP